MHKLYWEYIDASTKNMQSENMNSFQDEMRSQNKKEREHLGPPLIVTRVALG